MNFNTDYMLQIISTETSKEFYFKSYLEKSDVQVKFLDTNLQYAPLSFRNNTQLLKTQYSVDFSFNVFAESREEAFENYDKLHELFSMLRPNYIEIGNQLLPKANNIFGLIKLKFNGLPKLSNDPILTIYTTNFSYDINKDMGYLDSVEYNPLELNDPEIQKRIEFQKNSTERSFLVPIAYKLNISGRVLLPLEEMINIATNTYTPATSAVQEPQKPAEPPAAGAAAGAATGAAGAATAAGSDAAAAKSQADKPAAKPKGQTSGKKGGSSKNKSEPKNTGSKKITIATTEDAFLDAGGSYDLYDKFAALAIIVTDGRLENLEYSQKVQVFSILISAYQQGLVDLDTKNATSGKAIQWLAVRDKIVNVII